MNFLGVQLRHVAGFSGRSDETSSPQDPQGTSGDQAMADAKSLLIIQ